MADFEWGKVLVGVVSAAGTMWAAREQKKAQEKQYEYEQRMLEEQRQYQQDRVNAAQNTPIAKMAPILMQSVLQLYGSKLKKHGVDLPMDQLMAALGMGSGSTLQSAMAGGSGYRDTVSPEQRAQITATQEAFKRGEIGGAGGARMTNGSRVQRRADSAFDGMGDRPVSNGGSGDIFDQMFASQHAYMKGKGMLDETLITPEQMANFNLSAREFGNAHPLADKAGQYLFSALLGAAMPGPTIGASGLYQQLTKGSNENITDVYGGTNAEGLPVAWINGIPQYGDARLGG